MNKMSGTKDKFEMIHETSSSSSGSSPSSEMQNKFFPEKDKRGFYEIGFVGENGLIGTVRSLEYGEEIKKTLHTFCVYLRDGLEYHGVKVNRVQMRNITTKIGVIIKLTENEMFNRLAKRSEHSLEDEEKMCGLCSNTRTDLSSYEFEKNPGCSHLKHKECSERLSDSSKKGVCAFCMEEDRVFAELCFVQT
jgi:hypothetical protein